MKNSLKWTAAFLAACMMLSVGVMAEDVADETTEPTAEAEVAEATEEATEETAVDESAEAPAYTPAYVAIDGKEKSPLQAPSATSFPMSPSIAFSIPSTRAT